MTLSVADQHQRVIEHNLKITARNNLFNQILDICSTKSTAEEIAAALKVSIKSLCSPLSILIRRDYLKQGGVTLNSRGQKRTQYITIKRDFHDDLMKNEKSLITVHPSNPHIMVVHGADHIHWTRRESHKQEVRIGSTMGMLS